MRSRSSSTQARASRRASTMPPPTVSTHQLFSDQSTHRQHVLDAIRSAFAPGGPGILLVSDLYESFEHDRIKLFHGARALAKLPAQQLARLEVPHLQYAVGWSRGRERFQGVLDQNKGSFYANPIYDHPSERDAVFDAKYIHYVHSNHWPQHPSCHTVEPYFKKIGRYINTIAIQIAYHCDRYLETNLPHHHQRCSLEQLLRESKTAKGRLLHYFPNDSEQPSSPINKHNLWCGFHNDHGLITGLVSGAFYEHQNDTPMPRAPDQTAGLYVLRGADAELHKFSFPSDHLAFQIGETAQILSGGILRATPHAVKMPTVMRHISRVSFAVFLQPSPEVKLALPALSDEQSQEALSTHDCIPALSARYQKGNTFGEFAATTFKSYYDWNDGG